MKRPILLVAALALVVVSCSADTEVSPTPDSVSPAAETSSTTADAASPTPDSVSSSPADSAVVGPLLPGRDLSLSGVTSQQVRFVEATDGTAVLFEGKGDVVLTFNTSGGPATGSFTTSLSGEDGAGKSYVVTYEGVLTGTYDPERGWFDGTVVITGDTPPGFGAAIPDQAIWDGGIVVDPDGCAESEVECAFGATQPGSELIWELPLPADSIDPAYVASIK